MERYYEKVREFHEAMTDVEANEYLKKGFELLALKERTDMTAGGSSTRPVYLMGRFSD